MGIIGLFLGVLIAAELGVVVTALVAAVRIAATRVVYIDVPAGYATNVNAPAPELGSNAHLEESAWVEVTVSDASAAQIAWYLVHDGPPLVLALAMLMLLHRVVAKARSGQPFTTAVSNRLFALGFVLVVGAVLVAIAQLTASWQLVATISTSPAFYMRFNFVWWLAGFGFLAVGEVVRRAAAIRAELDEVI